MRRHVMSGLCVLLVSAGLCRAAGPSAVQEWKFGKAGGWGNFTTGSIDGTNGFRINGLVSAGQLGVALAASDVNGDGGRDLIVSAAWVSVALTALAK